MDRLTLRKVLLYFMVDIGTFVSVWSFVLTNSLLTFKLTQSPTSLGIIGFAQNVPFLSCSAFMEALSPTGTTGGEWSCSSISVSFFSHLPPLPSSCWAS